MATLAITLKAGQNSVFRLGFMLQAIFVFVAVAGLIYLGIAFVQNIAVLSLVTFIFMSLLLFLSKRYFDKMVFTEKIIVTYSKMTIIQRTFFKEVKHVFFLRDIFHLGFAEIKNSKIIKDTKKNPVILVKNAHIELETETDVYRFGKNITQQEANDLIKKIEEHLGWSFSRPVKESWPLEPEHSLL